MGLLDTTGRWGSFTRSLGRELLTWSFAPSRFTCDGILASVYIDCHVVRSIRSGDMANPPNAQDCDDGEDVLTGCLFGSSHC